MSLLAPPTSPRLERRLPARIVLADGQELMRAGLQAPLKDDSRWRIAGEASKAEETFETARRLQPDLLVLDADLLVLAGWQSMQTLRCACPSTSVLLLGTSAEPDFVLESFKAGAAGYLLKTASAAELRTAVWSVLNGDMPLDRHVTRKLLVRVFGERAATHPSPSHVRLSPREIEVIERVVQGHTNRQIATELVITLSTVKIHVEHIITKLGVRGRTQAAIRAVELGYIQRSANAASPAH